MATQKQIEANQRNAQKSTGPTSAAGKAASSMNALKTGIHAKSAIIKGESAADLQTLIDEYYASHQPDTPELRDLLDDLIACVWELRRLTRSEAQMWNYQMEDRYATTQAKYPEGKAASLNHKSHAALQRRIDSTRRGRDRILKLLREHRTNPIPVPEPAPAPPLTLCPPTASSEIGFVPSLSPQPLATPDFPGESIPVSHPEVVLS